MKFLIKIRHLLPEMGSKLSESNQFRSDLPFQTAAMHSLFFIFGRYSSTILATALLDKYPIRFWTMLSISCLVGSYILVYFAGYYATRDNFVYTQVVFGMLNGIGTGTGNVINAA